jgi:ribosomal protein S18 acetylase RimI-like enzyme
VEDAPTLLRVLQAAFEEYRGRLDPPSGAHRETAGKIRQKLTIGRAVVGLIEQTVVGCVFYQPQGDHVYLDRLAVLPEYRRRGLGRALVEYVEARARELVLPCIRLGVRTALPQNQAYYERMGYRVVEYASHAGYTEPTYLILEKDVD